MVALRGYNYDPWVERWYGTNKIAASHRLDELRLLTFLNSQLNFVAKIFTTYRVTLSPDIDELVRILVRQPKGTEADRSSRPPPASKNG